MKLIPTSISASTKVNGICRVAFQPRKITSSQWSSPSTRKRKKMGVPFLRNFWKRCLFGGLSKWYLLINVFRKKQEKVRVNTWYRFSICYKIQEQKFFKTHFVKSKKLSFMGSVSKLVNHSPYMHCFFASAFSTQKKNFPRFLPSHQRKSGPKNWRDT